MVRNILKTTRPAQRLEVDILRLLLNKVIFDCSRNTAQKTLAATVFIYDTAPTNSLKISCKIRSTKDIVQAKHP
jgi:hypothetical protein